MEITCAFACSSCRVDFSNCEVAEFSFASFVFSSVRKLCKKRLEKYLVDCWWIYHLVFVLQLLAGFLSSGDILPKTTKLSLVLVILQRKELGEAERRSKGLLKPLDSGLWSRRAFEVCNGHWGMPWHPNHSPDKEHWSGQHTPVIISYFFAGIYH